MSHLMGRVALPSQTLPAIAEAQELMAVPRLIVSAQVRLPLSCTSAGACAPYVCDWRW